MAYKPQVLSAVDGGTGQSVYAIGNVLYASSTTALSKLATGSNGQVLTLAAGIPSWATPTTGTVTSVSGTTNRITSTGGATPVIDISASYVGQTSITTLGTIGTGVWNGTNIALANGGTNASLTASNGGIFYSTATAGAILSGTATANKVLMSGASTTPSWSIPTYPNASATSGKIIISDGTNYIASTPTYPNASAASGKVIISDGTNFVASTPTYPNASATSGKIIISDGTNFVSSTPTFPNSASGTGTLLRADGTNWVATTSTYPNTNAVNTLLYASTANIMSALATANNGVLVTDGSGVPSISSTLPTAAQGNITSVGTIASGTWNGSVIDVAHGGTGNATQPAYSLVCGGTTTTGAFQSVSDVATGSVLVSGGTSALPTFSATPTVTSITFGAGTALSVYAEGTYTPTIRGNGTAGTPVYTAQNGYYTKVGNLVTITGVVAASSIGGSPTGSLEMDGFPFTVKNQTNGNPTGAFDLSSAGYTWSTGYTSLFLQGIVNGANALVIQNGSTKAAIGLTTTNTAQTCDYTLTYQV